MLNITSPAGILKHVHISIVSLLCVCMCSHLTLVSAVECVLSQCMYEKGVALVGVALFVMHLPCTP